MMVNVPLVHALVEQVRLLREGLGRAGSPHAANQKAHIVQEAHLQIDTNIHDTCSVASTG